MEGVFPNELSLQQVRVARPFTEVAAALRPLGHPGWHLSKRPWGEVPPARATHTDGTLGVWMN